MLLYWKIMQKIENFQKLKSFSAKLNYKVKNVCKKKMSIKWKNIQFCKALDPSISNLQKIVRNFK